MLPSNGFFSSFYCPYDKAKLCHRPYCHYKHAGKGEKFGVTEYLSDTNVPPIPPPSQQYTSLYTIEDDHNSATYIPTPVAKCTGILKNTRDPPISVIPVYNPTPISRLKELNNSQFTPQYSIPLKRKKKVEEYDPTEVKCTKTVTFAPTSTERSDSLPTFSDSEEEGADPSIVPTFSDDDLDDHAPAPVPPTKPVNPVPVEEPKKDEEDIDESKIDQFSLVDKIIVDCKKNEKFLSISSKTSTTTKSQKSKPVKVSKPKKTTTTAKKPKDDISDIYDCDLGAKDSKKSKSKEPSSISNKSSSKTSDKSQSSSKEDKNETKSKSKDSKSKEKSSKDDKSKADGKTKHSNKSESEKSSKSGSKSEKSKSHSEKSSSSSKNKTEKSVSSDSKLSKSKEAKLQDGKVSSSSISKNKLDHNSKSSDTSSKSKNSKDESKHMSSKLKESSNSKSSNKSSSKVEKMEVSDDSSDEDMADDIISFSDSDPDDECKRIFEETFHSEETHSSLSNNDPPPRKKTEVRDVTASQKKRFAHAAASDVKKPMSKARQICMKQLLNPEQVMINRYAKMKAIHEEQQEQQNSMKRLSTSPGRAPDKKRICYTPNQSLLAALEEKKKNLGGTSKFNPLPSTVSKSLKVAHRVAHVPDVVRKSRPVIPADFGSKVPTVVRQKFLNAFIDEYLKFSSSEDEAYANALEEEKKAYQRSSSKAIYMNVASNALNRLRHRPDVSKKNDGVTSTTKTISHEDMLNGPIAQRTSFSIAKKKPPPVVELKGPALYEQLKEYLLSEDQLKENGFPFPHPTELGRAVLQGVYASRTHYCNDPFKRTCCRCQKTYYVNVDGDYVREEECDFHWGRLWKRKIAGAFESRYTCCQGDSESDGCCVSLGHVFEGSEAHALKGFVSTLAKTPPPDNYHGIFALDCEMCYTTAGIELTRVSVIGPDLKPVYETFVKPQNKVIDYNTRFSGITEENLKDERTTIRDVQAVLLCMFNSQSILIGHSLESDLKALKLFHKTVVDTSVVFPHKMGLPYKRALRTLTVEKLNKIIQNDVGGHDSIEDAVACMELMIWKIKEDLKGSR